MTKQTTFRPYFLQVISLFILLTLALPALADKDYVPKSIDINKADTTVFIALPGIGSKLANRIVNYREKLHGFVAVEQVSETFGLPDSVFQNIRPLLFVSENQFEKININTATAEQLKTPYISYNLANVIYQYRQQHGSFQSLNDLKKIMLIDETLFQKISPYLSL